MKKKLLSVLLATAMLSTMIAGCGAKEEPAAAPTETETEAPAEGEAEAPAEGEAEAPAANGDMNIQIVSKGEQHQFWKAVKMGAEQAAADLGVTMEFHGPDSETEYAQQVTMISNAIDKEPAAIGLAALGSDAVMEAVERAFEAGIPMIGFDSGVVGAPEGAIYANASTDNYAAGELAGENTYPLIKDKIANAEGQVIIGVLSQDATSESVTNRGFGFIDKMRSLIEADGKTVSVTGHDLFIEKCGGETENADVVIEVKVPEKVDAALTTADAQALLAKENVICIYGSNEHSARYLVEGDANTGRLGDDVVGIGFDSGTTVNNAVRDGILAGAITQNPVQIGYKCVELCVKAAKGEAVENVDTGCLWYTAENMDSEEVAPCLYEG